MSFLQLVEEEGEKTRYGAKRKHSIFVYFITSLGAFLSTTAPCGYVGRQKPGLENVRDQWLCQIQLPNRIHPKSTPRPYAHITNLAVSVTIGAFTILENARTHGQTQSQLVRIFNPNSSQVLGSIIAQTPSKLNPELIQPWLQFLLH